MVSPPVLQLGIIDKDRAIIGVGSEVLTVGDLLSIIGIFGVAVSVGVWIVAMKRK